jgi:hypothetical protein
MDTNDQQLRVFWIVESASGLLEAFNHPYDARTYCYRANIPHENIICVREVKQ